FFALQVEGALPDSVDAPATPAAEAVAEPPRSVRTERNRDLDAYTFFDVGVAVGRAASIQEVGHAVWTRVKQHLPASAFILYVYDSAVDAIAPGYVGGAIAPEPTEVPLGDRLSGWAAATGKTVLNSDARLDLDEATRDDSPLRTALAVPVIVDGRPVCVFSFYAEAADGFDEGHAR